jgi:hypothetical protein
MSRSPVTAAVLPRIQSHCSEAPGGAFGCTGRCAGSAVRPAGPLRPALAGDLQRSVQSQLHAGLTGQAPAAVAASRWQSPNCPSQDTCGQQRPCLSSPWLAPPWLRAGRLIKLHHLRHRTASLLNKLRVPQRNAQMIRGYAHVPTTMQIYTHVDEEARSQALTELNDLLSREPCRATDVRNGCQPPHFKIVTLENRLVELRGLDTRDPLLSRSVRDRTLWAGAALRTVARRPSEPQS